MRCLVVLCFVILIGECQGNVTPHPQRENACTNHTSCGTEKYCANACRESQGCQTSAGSAISSGVSGLYCAPCSNCSSEYSSSGTCAHCNKINVCSCTTCLTGQQSCIDVIPGVCTRVSRTCTAVNSFEYIKAVWKGNFQYHTVEITKYTDDRCLLKTSVAENSCQVSKDFACKIPTSERSGDIIATCPMVSKYPAFEIVRYSGSCTSTSSRTFTTTSDGVCRRLEYLNHENNNIEITYMKAVCRTSDAIYSIGRTLDECQRDIGKTITFSNKEKCISDGSDGTFHKLTASSCFEKDMNTSLPTTTKICEAASFDVLGRSTGQDSDITKSLICKSGTIRVKKASYKSSPCTATNRLCHTTATQSNTCVSCVTDIDVTSDVKTICQDKKACNLNVPGIVQGVVNALRCSNAKYLEIEYGCSHCSSHVVIQRPTVAPVNCGDCFFTPDSSQCRDGCICLSPTAEACQCKQYEYVPPTTSDWLAGKLDLNPMFLPTVCRHPETYSCRAAESNGSCKTDYTACHQCGCTDTTKIYSFPAVTCLSSSGSCTDPTGVATCSGLSTCSKVSTPPPGQYCGCRRYIHPLTSNMGNSLLCISQAGDCYVSTSGRCAAGLSLCHQCGCGTLQGNNEETEGATFCISKVTNQCTLSPSRTCDLSEQRCQTTALSNSSDVTPQQACGCGDTSLRGIVCVHGNPVNGIKCSDPIEVGELLTCPDGAFICAATSANQLERLTFSTSVSSVVDKTVFDSLVTEMAKHSVTLKLDISCPATAFQCTELPCSFARPDMVNRGCTDYRPLNGIPLQRSIEVQQQSPSPTTKILDFYLTSTSGDSVQNIRNARSAVATQLSAFGASGYLVLAPGGIIVRAVTPTPTIAVFTSSSSSKSCETACIVVIIFIVLFAIAIAAILYWKCILKKPFCFGDDESNDKAEEGMIPVAGIVTTRNLGVEAAGMAFPQRSNPMDRLHEMSINNTRNAGNTPAVIDVPENGWQIGAACEAEYHGSWHPATITDFDGELYEVKWTEDDTLSKVLPAELRAHTSIIDTAIAAGAVPVPSGATPVVEATESGVAIPISEVVGDPVDTPQKSENDQINKGLESITSGNGFAQPISSAAEGTAPDGFAQPVSSVVEGAAQPVSSAVEGGLAQPVSSVVEGGFAQPVSSVVEGGFAQPVSSTLGGAIPDGAQSVSAPQAAVPIPSEVAESIVASPDVVVPNAASGLDDEWD